jgi:hypothetical protein
MNYYSNADDFQRDLDRVNALGDRYRGWQRRRARKDHDDALGAQIQSGEYYFTREYGVAYHEVLKLSERSMELFLTLLFLGNQHAGALADHIQSERCADMADAVKGLKL